MLLLFIDLWLDIPPLSDVFFPVYVCNTLYLKRCTLVYSRTSVGGQTFEVYQNKLVLHNMYSNLPE